MSDDPDEGLRRRLHAALDTAEAILGISPQPETTAAPTAERVGDLVAALVDALRSHPGDGDAAVEQAAHEANLARLTARTEERLASLEQVRAAVTRLRAITSPTAMLEAAAGELCASSALERVLLSSVRDGTLTVEHACFRDDPTGSQAALDALAAAPMPLEHPLIETEVLRRRRATIVAEAQVHPRVHRSTARIMRWESYAAAPVTVRANVIAVLHADRGPGQGLDVLHRDVLWEFATGLAQAYESASLRRTLRHEREQMRQFLEWLNAWSGELTDAAIQLSPRPLPTLPRPQPLDPGPLRGRDDSKVFEGVLTRRELEVLRLLSEGRSNRAIADDLVISDGTAKFHVNSILRKLRVANRAEAVARYYALLGIGARGS